MNQKQVEAIRGEQTQALALALFEAIIAAHKDGTSRAETLQALSIITGAAINEFPEPKTVRVLFDRLLDYSMAKAAKHFPRDWPTVN